MGRLELRRVNINLLHISSYWGGGGDSSLISKPPVLHVIKWTRPSLLFSHTASNQKLDGGKAMVEGASYIPRVECVDG